jgi:hypothetical protein
MYTKGKGVGQDLVRAHMWLISLPQHRPAILEMRRQRIEIELRQKRPPRSWSGAGDGTTLSGV